MGVRGLQSFLEDERQIRHIKIASEINKWKKYNSGRIPTIVIDFDSLTKSFVMKNHRENMCGGRHQFTLDRWKELLNAFKATGCKLIFIADSNIQRDKIDKWLSSRNNEFNRSIKFYDAVSNGDGDPKTGIKLFPQKPFRFALYGMAVMAQSFGKLLYSVKREADLEIIHQAKLNDAMAIISNDTDFLIFKGRWRLWSSDGIIRSKLKLATFEYNSVGKVLSLPKHQLPLLATLAGNDVTDSINLKLDSIFKRDHTQHKIRNVAKFIRENCAGMDCNRMSDSDIQHIVQQMLNSANSKWENLIRTSIASYNTNIPPVAIVDPIEKALHNSEMYTPYVENMSTIQSLNMQFYDLRGMDPETNLPNLLTDWVKRRKGVLMKNAGNPSSTFTLLVKKDFSEKYKDHEESVICPDPEFPVPPLDELYLKPSDDESTKNLNENRWKIFGWIMSIDDEIISVIKQLPNEFILISTTLYVLVKNRLINIEAADGILHTEKTVYEKKSTNTNFPRAIEAQHIRAAHVYNITFSAVRENFAIAGLLPIIEKVIQFDGVYFQNHMKNMAAGLSETQRESFLSPIQKYRIYDVQH